MTEEERREATAQITNTLPIRKEIREDFGGFVADTVMGGHDHLGL